MKKDITMREVLEKHSRGPKEFAEKTGMTRSTCEKISCGKNTHFEVFAPWLDYALSRGKTIDELKKEVRYG